MSRVLCRHPRKWSSFSKISVSFFCRPSRVPCLLVMSMNTRGRFDLWSLGAGWSVEMSTRKLCRFPCPKKSILALCNVLTYYINLHSMSKSRILIWWIWFIIILEVSIIIIIIIIEAYWSPFKTLWPNTSRDSQRVKRWNLPKPRADLRKLVVMVPWQRVTTKPRSWFEF